jgi:hypothetical protein
MKLPNRAKKERGRKVYFESDVEQVLDRSGAIPTVHQYGGHKGNYGSHCMSFGFMGISFWFSYHTLIAFHVPGYEQVVMENYWQQTTGRHIGAATHSWKTERVSNAEFLVRLNNQLRGYLGVTKLTLPFLRLDADPKTLERSGFIGACKGQEDEVPPPKPKKSEFYLHPKKDTKYMKQKRAREAREEKQRLERLRQKQSIDDEYGDQLREYQGAMI